MTPWQLGVVMKADLAERQHAHGLRAWHAWHTAALGRVKRLPKLSALMPDRTAKADVASRLKAVMKTSFPAKKG